MKLSKVSLQLIDEVQLGSDLLLHFLELLAMGSCCGFLAFLDVVLQFQFPMNVVLVLKDMLKGLIFCQFHVAHSSTHFLGLFLRCTVSRPNV